MIVATALEIRSRARERWGRRIPKDMEAHMSILATLQQSTKQDAVLGPTLNDAALAVSRRLREEK